MNSRERVLATINHRIPDRVPIDLGGSHVTTFSANAYQNVRAALQLEKKPCELTELFMFCAKGAWLQEIKHGSQRRNRILLRVQSSGGDGRFFGVRLSSL